MKNINNRHLIPVLFIALALSLPVLGQAQDTAGTEQSQFNAVQVQTGQRLKVEGVIFEKQSAGLTMADAYIGLDSRGEWGKYRSRDKPLVKKTG